jgi:hypothetical protein
MPLPLVSTEAAKSDKNFRRSFRRTPPSRRAGSDDPAHDGTEGSPVNRSGGPPLTIRTNGREPRL